MQPKGSAKELEVWQRIASKLLQEGKGIRMVARLVGASPYTIHGWKQALNRGGSEALKAKPHLGRPAGLTPEQKQELEWTLQAGPLAAGFPTDLWTLARIAQVIEHQLGVKYYPGHMWKILQALNWSPQKPERRAREQDEEAIKQWRKEDWPRVIRKLISKAGASS